VVQSLDGTIQVLTGQPRARLGLYLAANCVNPDATALCDRPPVVVSVVEDGPADRAGVRQQDTLVALDGNPLSTLEGRLALQSLESGTAVLLSVAGPEGRRELKVIPEIRTPAQVVNFEWRSPDADGVREQFQMFRFPPDAEDWDLKTRFDSIVGEGSERTFVMFGPDSDGQLRVEIVGTDSVGVISRLDARTSETVTTGYVVESRELAKRLEEVRDRTLRIARIQLDSLVRLLGRGVDVMIAPSPSADGARWAPAEDELIRYQQIPGWPGFESMLTSNRRVAGAEFLELTPDLAEYFAGVQEGLLVLRVIPHTPAGQLGLRDGDVVIEADGGPVQSIEIFRARIVGADGGGTAVKWIRKGVEAEGRLSIP
jgi:membrane-associated protease RseP (regulator of RpoE activity)